MADERRFGPGETLFAEGDPSAEVLLIRSGEVEVLKEVDGGSVLLGTLGADEFVGEMGVIQERPRSATIRAIGEVTAEAVPKDEFLRRISEDSATAFQLLVRLSERLRQADLQLAQSAGLTAAGDLAPVAAGDLAPVAAGIEPAAAAAAVRVLAASDEVAAALPRDGLAVDRFPFTVGRRPEEGEATPPLTVDLQLPDTRPYRLSRAHFAIRRHGRGYVVSDLGSVLGTAVNSKFLGHHFPIDAIDLRLGENAVTAGGAHSPFAFKIVVEPA